MKNKNENLQKFVFFLAYLQIIHRHTTEAHSGQRHREMRRWIKARRNQRFPMQKFLCSINLKMNFEEKFQMNFEGKFILFIPSFPNVLREDFLN